MKEQKQKQPNRVEGQPCAEKEDVYMSVSLGNLFHCCRHHPETETICSFSTTLDLTVKPSITWILWRLRIGFVTFKNPTEPPAAARAACPRESSGLASLPVHSAHGQFRF